MPNITCSGHPVKAVPEPTGAPACKLKDSGHIYVSLVGTPADEEGAEHTVTIYVRPTMEGSLLCISTDDNGTVSPESPISVVAFGGTITYEPNGTSSDSQINVDTDVITLLFTSDNEVYHFKYTLVQANISYSSYAIVTGYAPTWANISGLIRWPALKRPPNPCKFFYTLYTDMCGSTNIVELNFIGGIPDLPNVPDGYVRSITAISLINKDTYQTLSLTSPWGTGYAFDHVSNKFYLFGYPLVMPVSGNGNPAQTNLGLHTGIPNTWYGCSGVDVRVNYTDTPSIGSPIYGSPIIGTIDLPSTRPNGDTGYYLYVSAFHNDAPVAPPHPLNPSQLPTSAVGYSEISGLSSRNTMEIGSNGSGFAILTNADLFTNGGAIIASMEQAVTAAGHVIRQYEKNMSKDSIPRTEVIVGTCSGHNLDVTITVTIGYNRACGGSSVSTAIQIAFVSGQISTYGTLATNLIDARIKLADTFELRIVLDTVEFIGSSLGYGRIRVTEHYELRY